MNPNRILDDVEWLDAKAEDCLVAALQFADASLPLGPEHPSRELAQIFLMAGIALGATSGELQRALRLIKESDTGA